MQQSTTEYSRTCTTYTSNGFQGNYWWRGHSGTSQLMSATGPAVSDPAKVPSVCRLSPTPIQFQQSDQGTLCAESSRTSRPACTMLQLQQNCEGIPCTEFPRTQSQIQLSCEGVLNTEGPATFQITPSSYSAIMLRSPLAVEPQDTWL